MRSCENLFSGGPLPRGRPDGGGLESVEVHGAEIGAVSPELKTQLEEFSGVRPARTHTALLVAHIDNDDCLMVVAEVAEQQPGLPIDLEVEVGALSRQLTNRAEWCVAASEADNSVPSPQTRLGSLSVGERATESPKMGTNARCAGDVKPFGAATDVPPCCIEKLSFLVPSEFWSEQQRTAALH